jgi:glycosyl hydrolase family 113
MQKRSSISSVMRSLIRSVPVVFLVALTAPARSDALPAARQRGVALGLFSEDPGFSYRPLLDEIRATGADHVELVVAWYLDDVHATGVHAHAAGLGVLLFPILRLERQGRPDEWRGTLAPRDEAALFASYGAKLLALARMADREHVELLSIGSELSSLDGKRGPWEALARRVRAVYNGPLTYSGNWDHFDAVAIYDLVDYAGLCGYFQLSASGVASDDELGLGWRALRARLAAFRASVRRPLLFTEVGYLSQRGASAWPWNEGAMEPVDLDEQRRCYRAFAAAWGNAPPGLLAGVYFWNWYGWGGARSRGYTPRGKPAADEIRAFFSAPR